MKFYITILLFIALFTDKYSFGTLMLMHLMHIQEIKFVFMTMFKRLRTFLFLLFLSWEYYLEFKLILIPIRLSEYVLDFVPPSKWQTFSQSFIRWSSESRVSWQDNQGLLYYQSVTKENLLSRVIERVQKIARIYGLLPLRGRGG